MKAASGAAKVFCALFLLYQEAEKQQKQLGPTLNSLELRLQESSAEEPTAETTPQKRTGKMRRKGKGLAM